MYKMFFYIIQNINDIKKVREYRANKGYINKRTLEEDIEFFNKNQSKEYIYFIENGIGFVDFFINNFLKNFENGNNKFIDGNNIYIKNIIK